MKHAPFAALHGRQPGGRLVSACMILLLTTLWLTPTPAAAGSRRPQETREPPLGTLECRWSNSPSRDGTLDLNDSTPSCLDADGHTTANNQTEGPSIVPLADHKVLDAGVWVAGFGSPGTSDTVSALAVGPDGSLYAGGYFTTAGGTVAKRIARWDGPTSSWRALGSGMEGDTGPAVRALALDPDGSLYAGGNFITAGGITANSIARWDGPTSSWHALGSGMSGISGHPATIRALVMGADGSLYAGGSFSSAGGTAANSIARWDGAAWHPLGSGTNSVVNALAFGPDGSLYAGGWFTTAGGVAANHIARWDGPTSSWHPLGTGVDDAVYALAFGPDGSLYAGGSFTNAGEVTANRIARWDGSIWHALGNGMGGASYPEPWVGSLVFGQDGSLFAGGEFTTAGGITANYIAWWDGPTSSWRSLASGVNYPVHALALGPNGALYAGGALAVAGGVAASKIARWDQASASWHAIGRGNGLGSILTPSVEALAAGPGDSLYAGGEFWTAGGVTANHIARWDGAAWHPLGSGVNQNGVRALAFGPDGSLYAGGNFTTAGGVAADSIARWDETTSSWHPLGSGIDGHVFALAFGPDGSLYAGGDFTSAGGVVANHVARWDGPTSSWHPLGSGIEGCRYDGCVRTLAFGPDGSLVAGGWFTMEGASAANNIARWDGAVWRALGAGMNESVEALAFGPDGSLYAGGWFTTAGGVAASRIARWDGTTWRPLGSGLSAAWGNYYVLALAFGADGSLYAGGQFTRAGDVPVSNIARWDGAAWEQVGSGTDRSVHALAPGPTGSLYTGGRFLIAGGVPSSGIARWLGGVTHTILLPMVVHSD